MALANLNDHMQKNESNFYDISYTKSTQNGLKSWTYDLKQLNF